MVSNTREVPIFTLNEKMKKQFKETRDLLDGILETFEILEDEAAMKRIELSEQELTEGKKVNLKDVMKKLMID